MSRERDFLNGLMQANKEIDALRARLSQATQEIETLRAALQKLLPPKPWDDCEWTLRAAFKDGGKGIILLSHEMLEEAEAALRGFEAGTE